MEWKWRGGSNIIMLLKYCFKQQVFVKTKNNSNDGDSGNLLDSG